MAEDKDVRALRNELSEQRQLRAKEAAENKAEIERLRELLRQRGAGDGKAIDSMGDGLVTQAKEIERLQAVVADQAREIDRLNKENDDWHKASRELRATIERQQHLLDEERKLTAATAEHTTALERRVVAETESKNRAYRERNMLVAALSKHYPSHLMRHPDADTTWEDDWRWIVCIESPAGQMTWHLHDSHLPLFSHLVEWPNHWDGHTTDEKYARLEALPKPGATP